MYQVTLIFIRILTSLHTREIRQVADNQVNILSIKISRLGEFGECVSGGDRDWWIDWGITVC